jgi:hypothetical protein
MLQYRHAAKLIGEHPPNAMLATYHGYLIQRARETQATDAIGRPPRPTCHQPKPPPLRLIP